MMAAVTVDLDLMPELRRYGAFDVDACFNCGTCTAVCPLTADDSTFPRRLIRYGQVGMRDALLSSPELWACYGCGECSESCPRQAEPADFMAAARRYAVASYDRTGLARVLATRPVVATLLAVLVALGLAAFMYTAHGPMSTTSLDLFAWIPAALVHDVGVVAIVLVALAGLAGAGRMIAAAGGAAGIGWRSVVGSRAAVGRSAAALWRALAIESIGQSRYRRECTTPGSDDPAGSDGPPWSDAPDAPQAAAASGADALPWYRRRWFIHAATMWGFLGLLAATILDYGLALAGLRTTGTPVPPWYPVRLLGTAAGLLLLYGTTMLILRRRRAAERSLRHSTPGDWTFLALLWAAGATGFVLELALYLPESPAWGYWVFLVHVAVAMELVLLAPFTKFAHAFYRPVGLFFRELAREPARTEGGTR